MYYVSKTTRVVPDFANERKVQSTLAHIGRGWLPADPAALQDIQKKLASGYFVDNRPALVAAVKDDLALLSHTARFVRSNLQEPLAVLNPLRDLDFLPDEELDRLFDVSPQLLSKHRLSQGTKLRFNIMRSAVVAANAAEAIAGEVRVENPAIEEMTAFSSAAFSQLGWNLVAWNYPDLLSSAMRSARKDRNEASAQLRKILGIAPQQLSGHFASEWLFEPTLRDSLRNDDRNRSRNSDDFRTPAQIISTVRESAETFAALETGLAGKDDEKRWEKQQQTLAALAPNANFTALQKQIRIIVEPCLDRLSFFESTKRTVAFSRPEPKPTRTEHPFAGNNHLQRCPKEIQNIFKPIYEALGNQRMSVDALQSLISEAIPAAGFPSGCIYLLHATRPELVPAVKLGDAASGLSARQRKVFESAAIDSFNSPIPVRTHEVTEDGQFHEHVSAAFGDSERPGVLLLEVDQTVAERSDFDSTLVFKAVRRCLHDCLGMKAGD